MSQPSLGPEEIFLKNRFNFFRLRIWLAGFSLLLLLGAGFYPARSLADHLEEGASTPEKTTYHPSAPNDFDFYLLALTWSPSFCANLPPGRIADTAQQCSSGLGFVIHGLWPQRDDGSYPKNCAEGEGLNEQFAAVALGGALSLPPGNKKFLEHEWLKHGTCSGLSQQDYFRAVASAAQNLNVPTELQQPDKEIQHSVGDVKQIFSLSTKGLSREAIDVKIDEKGRFSEVWICLSKQLVFIPCQGIRKLDEGRVGVFPRVN